MSQIKTSTNDSPIAKKSESDRLARLRQKIKDIQALQETKLAQGVDGIEQYVEDVEGDWLENWDDEE
jgi:hypothetical protein